MYFIVCDDNKDFADYFGKQLSETEPDSIVKVFHSAKRLLFNLPELSGYVDAIFLDINLENMNGIDVAVDIQHRYPNISIVYITSYPDDYSQAIFNCPPDVVPAAFLVKPVKTEYLKNAIERIKGINRNSENDKRFICVKTQQEKYIIRTDKITHISVQGRKLTIYTPCEETKEITVNSTLSQFMNMLPKNFVQCHKSYCVNLEYVRNFNGWKTVTLTDNTEIDIGRSFVNNFKRIVTEMYSVLQH